MILETRIQRSDQVVGDSTISQVRGDQTSGIMVSDAHPRYLDAVRRGNVYSAAMQAVAAASVTLTASACLTVTNPVGSGKNLALLELLCLICNPPAGVSVVSLYGLLGGTAAVTHTTPILAGAAGFQNMLTGQAGSTKTLVDSVATVPAPGALRPVAASVVTTTNAFSPYIKDQIDGALIIPPGGFVSFGALTTAMNILATLTWEEVPV
jgi:hypothetical protein